MIILHFKIPFLLLCHLESSAMNVLFVQPQCFFFNFQSLKLGPKICSLEMYVRWVAKL